MRSALAVSVAACLVALTGCAQESAPSDPAPPTDPLTQMTVAFEGGYTAAEIQAVMDRALTAAGEELTSETYSRAGSALVALRKSTGVPEMEIAACIPEVAAAADNMTFPDAAALCVTDLATR